MIQHHIPGEWNPQVHHCKNLKLARVIFFFENLVHSFWLIQFPTSIHLCCNCDFFRFHLSQSQHIYIYIYIYIYIHIYIYIYLHLLTDTLNISKCSFVDPNGIGPLQCSEVQSVFVVGCAWISFLVHIFVHSYCFVSSLYQSFDFHDKIYEKGVSVMRLLTVLTYSETSIISLTRYVLNLFQWHF
jgi:hypothetical protein